MSYADSKNGPIPHIGHVHLKVRDLERAREFYTKVLGLTITEHLGRYLFLSYGHEHHDVALNEVGSEADRPKKTSVGLYHFAIEVATLSEFKAFYYRLQRFNVLVRPRDQGISKTLYFEDPDGNGIELYVDTRSESGRFEWRGESKVFDVNALSA